MTIAEKLLSSGISEQEAIDRAKLGDVECFEALYGLHKRRVYPLCLRMTGNTAEAEDLTQEAFLQLHRKIATFRGESAFSTWLHRLTVNVVLMHLRKKRLPEVSLEEPWNRRRTARRRTSACATVSWQALSTGSSWRGPSRGWLRDTASSLPCMMLRASNTRRLPE
jgi:RNA polymerase sigma factor (sigma-70 family)